MLLMALPYLLLSTIFFVLMVLPNPLYGGLPLLLLLLPNRRPRTTSLVPWQYCRYRAAVCVPSRFGQTEFHQSGKELVNAAI